MLLFSANEFDGELVSLDEGAMLWVNRNEICSLQIADGFNDVMKIYDEDLTELYYEKNEENMEWVMETS